MFYEINKEKERFLINLDNVKFFWLDKERQEGCVLFMGDDCGSSFTLTAEEYENIILTLHARGGLKGEKNE